MLTKITNFSFLIGIKSKHSLQEIDSYSDLYISDLSLFSEEKKTLYIRSMKSMVLCKGKLGLIYWSNCEMFYFVI